jgi:hypothetical protein
MTLWKKKKRKQLRESSNLQKRVSEQVCFLNFGEAQYCLGLLAHHGIRSQSQLTYIFIFEWVTVVPLLSFYIFQLISVVQTNIFGLYLW